MTMVVSIDAALAPDTRASQTITPITANGRAANFRFGPIMKPFLDRDAACRANAHETSAEHPAKIHIYRFSPALHIEGASRFTFDIDRHAREERPMDLSAVTPQMVLNLSLLLLIGMGPKIALVPFLEKTKHLDAQQQREVGTRMVKTAVITALVLFAAGALLMRLLHISSGAVGIAGGIMLLILALKMASGSDKEKVEIADSPVDHRQMAVYPLAIPFLLNPVGIAVLIIASSEVGSILAGAVVIGLVLLVGAFDWVVFRNIDKLSKRLNPTSLIISEIVFGILLMALAVELVVGGLARFGIIDAIGQH